MLYLIGWSPKSGKTSLAQYMHENLKIPYIPGDYLKRIIHSYVDEKLFSKAAPIFFQNIRGKERYDNYSSQSILENYIGDAELCREWFQNFIDYALHDNFNFILEGYPILPKLVEHLKGNDNIKIVFLYKRDTQKIIEGAENASLHNDWLKNTDSKTQQKMAEMIALFGGYIEEEAKNYGFLTYDMVWNYMEIFDKIIKKIKT